MTTPMTQEQFNAIVLATPAERPIVVKNRSVRGGITIGNYADNTIPDNRDFKFIECKFGTINIENTNQHKITLSKCKVNSITLTTNGNVEQMEVRNSKINGMATMEGSKCERVDVIKSIVGGILNNTIDNTLPVFQVIAVK